MRLLTPIPESFIISYKILLRGYLWVTAADNLYAYKITDDASLDKVDLSRLLSADRKILTKILSDQSETYG